MHSRPGCSVSCCVAAFLLHALRRVIRKPLRQPALRRRRSLLPPGLQRLLDACDCFFWTRLCWQDGCSAGRRTGVGCRSVCMLRADSLKLAHVCQLQQTHARRRPRASASVHPCAAPCCVHCCLQRLGLSVVRTWAFNNQFPRVREALPACDGVLACARPWVMRGQRCRVNAVVSHRVSRQLLAHWQRLPPTVVQSGTAVCYCALCCAEPRRLQ